MIQGVGQLSRAGVLGINRRNCDYISIYNSRRLYPLVDDKLRTKELAQKAGISVPELYGVVEIYEQTRHLGEHLVGRRDFVIKPARGSGGEGVLVIVDRSGTLYRSGSGNLLREEELAYHMIDIISGRYSLGGHRDRAMIEYRVEFDPIFEPITYFGVPDIRIVAFLGVPVMAMVRLPTRISGGRANLHQGAIGAGIDIATGTTLTAVFGNDVVSDHPDTGKPVTGLRIPHWRRLLGLASSCYELTGLGYLGVDLVLDRSKGPFILELNARPGLNIQIANRAGLQPRLRVVSMQAERLTTAEQRVAFARRHFGG